MTKMHRKPTIYEALAKKLGRRPTSTEIKDEVVRIIAEGRALALRR